MHLIYPLLYATLSYHVWCLLYKKPEILTEIGRTLRRMCFLAMDAGVNRNSPIDSRVSQSMIAVKVKQARVVGAIASFGYWIVLVPAGLFVESTPGLTLTLSLSLACYVTCLVFTFTSLRLSSRLIDTFCSLFMLCFMCRLFVMNGDITFFFFGGIRVFFRIVFSLMFLNIHKVVFWNMLLSTVTCWQYTANISVFNADVLRHDHMLSFLIIELSTLTGVVTLAAVVQLWIESRVRAILDAECAHHGMHKLLSALCDAVLRLGPDLHVTSATPQFLHLLGRQHAGQEDGVHTLEDRSFISHIASGTDQHRFQDFISASESHMTDAQSEGGPPALLPLHMQDAQGRRFPVEVFHAHIPETEQKAGHLLGIRVVGELPTMEAPETLDHRIFQLDESASAAPDPRSGPPGSITRRRKPSRASTRSSSSWESVMTCQHTALPQITDISLVVDAFHPRLRVYSCKINFAVDEEDTSTQDFVDWIYQKSEAEQLVVAMQTFLNSAAVGCSSDCSSVGPLLLRLPAFASDGNFNLLCESVSFLLERSLLDAEQEAGEEAAAFDEHDMFNSEFNTTFPVVLKLEALGRLQKVWKRQLKKPRMAPVIEGGQSTAAGKKSK